MIDPEECAVRAVEAVEVTTSEPLVITPFKLPDRPFQERIAEWVRSTLGANVASNAPERSLRAAEEAIELTQACGIDARTVHRLVDYVFSRPAGLPSQEIAGTLVSTYAVASALGVDAHLALEVELARINTPEVIERVRRRQSEKREALSTREWPETQFEEE